MSDVSKMILQQLKGMGEGQALKFLEKVREEAQDAHLAEQAAQETKLTKTRTLSIDELTAHLDKLHKMGPSNFDKQEHQRYAAVLNEKTTALETQRQAAIDEVPKQLTLLDAYVLDLEKLLDQPEQNIAEISRLQRKINDIRYGVPRYRV